MSDNCYEEDGSGAHRRACAVLRATLERAQRTILGEGAKDVAPIRAPQCDDEFIVEVRSWIAAVRDASRRGWDAKDAWHNAYRHYLSCVVGPRARTELGRAAGQCGYRMLAREFSVLFGRPTSSYPMVCEHCHDSTSRDADLVAMFCAIPVRLQRDPRLVSRLLGLAARLACADPRLLDRAAGEHLAELQRVQARAYTPCAPG